MLNYQRVYSTQRSHKARFQLNGSEWLEYQIQSCSKRYTKDLTGTAAPIPDATVKTASLRSEGLVGPVRATLPTDLAGGDLTSPTGNCHKWACIVLLYIYIYL